MSNGTAPGTLQIYDNYVPILTPGDYIVDVAQHVNPPGVDDTFQASQAFSVGGPRWSLPAADVFSVYPPSEAVGQFDRDLPHVVLTARELPWERDVFGDGQTPWLALLVLEPDELLVDDPKTANRARSKSVPVSDLFNPPALPANTLWPKLTAEWYEADAIAKQTCRVVDIAPDTFGKLLPSTKSLQYFAHARLVDVTAKDADVLRVTGDGWYSVVVANRLPAASTGSAERSIVHLVSLEGLADQIGTSPHGYDQVRLVSLYSWTFTCAEIGETFSELVEGLDRSNGGAFTLPVTEPTDADADEAQACAMLSRAYVPLPWRTRLGEQTWAWYRGPLSAEPVTDFVDPGQPSTTDTGWQPFGTASSALVYDKDWGVFNLSYAVAWETGRLLALADGAFSRALVDWRRRGHGLVDLIAERMAQVLALKTLKLDDPTTEQQVLALIKPYAVTDGFLQYLLTQLTEEVTPRLAAPDAEPPDPALPPYPSLPAASSDPQTLADLMTETGIQEAIRDLGARELDAIANWLAQRYLLMGVPFEALVPRAEMLPAESIRFFYVDVNWLDALLEGALSIGVESSRDVVYQDLMKDIVWDTAVGTVTTLRDNLLNVTSQSGVEPPAMAGMLLRSALVSGWPGLEVQGYSSQDLAKEIPLLRMERLSGGVMLCLWPEVPAAVAVAEPSEGIAFGFEDAPQDAPKNEQNDPWLDLRSLADGNYGVGIGKQIDAAASITSDRILEVGPLLTQMQQQQLGKDNLAVRDFATEMIRVPEQAVFAATTS